MPTLNHGPIRLDEGGWCPNCSGPMDKNGCVVGCDQAPDTGANEAAHADTARQVSAPQTAPAATALASAPDAASTTPGAVHLSLLERLLTIAVDGRTRRTQARAGAKVAKANAKTRRAQLKADAAATATATHGKENENDTDSEHGTLPWPVMLVFIPAGIFFYLIFYGIATLGQGLAIANPRIADEVFGHLGWNISLGVGMGIGGVIEFASLFFLLFAIVQRIAGERAYSATVIGYLLAFVSIGLNVFGHAWLGDVYGTVIFGGASLIAFAAGALMAEFIVRVVQRRRGVRNFTPPPFPLRYWKTDRDRVLRARELFRVTPALKMQGAWDAALEQRKAEEREAELERKAAADKAELQARVDALVVVLRQISHMKYPNDAALAEIWFLRNDVRLMAEKLIERTDVETSLAEIEGLMDRAEAELVTERRNAIVSEYVGQIGAGIADPIPAADPKANPNGTEPKARKGTRKLADLFGFGGPKGSAAADPKDTRMRPGNNSAEGAETVPEQQPEMPAAKATRIASEQTRTVTIPAVSDDDAKLKAETEAWLMQQLADGKRAPSKFGITYAEIERRLGKDPDVGGGNNGKNFYLKVLEKYEAIEERAKEGVTR